MIIPNISFPKRLTKGVWGEAAITKGTPGTIYLLKEYPSYVLFLKTFIHELGHIWVAKVIGNRRETHGKYFKQYVKLIKRRLNGLDVLVTTWVNTHKDIRKGKWKTQ